MFPVADLSVQVLPGDFCLQAAYGCPYGSFKTRTESSCMSLRTNETSENPAVPLRRTATSPFGAVSRQGHDSSVFYKRFKAPLLTTDDLPPHDPARSARIDALTAEPCRHGDARDMSAVPDGCVALVVTSPPYFVGKEYELGSSADYSDHLRLLEGVFAECVRVLEPGGRIAVNVANLGRNRDVGQLV